MIERFAQFPRALAQRARSVRFGDVPVLLAHPDWQSPAPTVFWMHGRTVHKELDSGRYLRWLRAGIATCAIDLPGHGERADPKRQQPGESLGVLEEALKEIDWVVENLADPTFGGAFDLDRLAIGGMSLGGMVALRRLCDPHDFVCGSVESTTGWLKGLYFGGEGAPAPTWPARHDPERVRPLDPSEHIGTFRACPLQVLHSEADEVIPFAVQKRFVEDLRRHYQRVESDPALVEVKTWPSTGAPQEHSGFGRVAAEAKSAQVEFLTRNLRPDPPKSEA